MIHVRFGFVPVLLTVLTAVPAFAQDSLQVAKELYASAAYEDALKMLSRLQLGDPKVEQYRVSCLVALGRNHEAARAIESVVTADPSFVPDGADVSPRIQELFARARRQMLPDIAERIYGEAKIALERKDREIAVAKFEGVVRLLDSVNDLSGTLQDLRLLAAGFLDLSRALPGARPASASPPPSESSKQTMMTSKAREITPPVAVKQAMPAWLPSDNVSRQGSFLGSVKVSITADGRVAAAEIVRSIHPTYDRLLLQAARTWEYQPARSDGTAVPSEQLVQVQLKPRQ